MRWWKKGGSHVQAANKTNQVVLVQLPILEQIYNSWDIHGETRRTYRDGEKDTEENPTGEGQDLRKHLRRR